MPSNGKTTWFCHGCKANNVPLSSVQQKSSKAPTACSSYSADNVSGTGNMNWKLVNDCTTTGTYDSNSERRGPLKKSRWQSLCQHFVPGNLAWLRHNSSCRGVSSKGKSVNKDFNAQPWDQCGILALHQVNLSRYCIQEMLTGCVWVQWIAYLEWLIYMTACSTMPWRKKSIT